MDPKKRKKSSAKLKTNKRGGELLTTTAKVRKVIKVKKVIRKSLRKSIEPDALNGNNNIETVLPTSTTPKKRMNSTSTLALALRPKSIARAGTKRKAESKGGTERNVIEKEKGQRARIYRSKYDIISPPAKKAKKSSKDNNVSKINSTKNNKQPKKPQKRSQREDSSRSPGPATLNPHFVEFEFDGQTEYFGINVALNLIDNTSFEGFTEPSTPFSFMQDDSYPSSPMTPISGHFHHKKGRGGAGKGKGNKKNKGKNNKSQKQNSGTSTQQQLLAAALLAAELEDKKQSKLPEAQFDILDDFKMSEAPSRPNAAYIRYIEVPQEDIENDVEYELDEEDLAWLDLFNKKRKESSVQIVKPEIMELLMDKLEKESHFQMQSSDYEHKPLIDDDAVCCICMDGECQNSNAILFCDMCNLAVHQECYGVPYIPEGQWLCRRCLQSPSKPVDCALCPNKGNAFKETNDGRWAHVVCAIWIPEVCFANTVFLEPVDNISSIPTARWKLCCYICKQKGVGACIQCHKSNCYTAFHVTCAQQAGLYMKMDTVKDSHSYVVKKIAYCDSHAPPDDDKDSPTSRQRMRKARKLLAEKRIEIPRISIPTIPTERVEQIASIITFPKKNVFINQIMPYWKLKRQTRNGVPLLRRLQSANPFPSLTGMVDDENKKNTNAQDSYRYYIKLRQDIEKARLLCELVRKREKLKREEVHTRCREVIYKIQPMIHFLHNLLEELSRADAQGIFAEPVNTQEVVDYLDIITKPMDFSTMKDKISSYEYKSVEDLEKDFNLIISNCLTYNSRDTVFFRTASKVKEHGAIILRQAKKEWIYNGFDPETGLHLNSPPPKRPLVVLTDDKLLRQIDEKLDDDSRLSLPFTIHLELLNQLYDNSLDIKNTMARKKRLNRVRNETQRIKKQKYQKPSEISTNYSKSLAEQLLREKARRSELLTTDSEDLSHQEDSQDSFKFLKRIASSTNDKDNVVEEDNEGELDKEESEPQPRVLRPLKKKEEQTSRNGRKIKKSLKGKSAEKSNEIPLGSKNARLRRKSVSTNGPLYVKKNQQLNTPSVSLKKKNKKYKNKKYSKCKNRSLTKKSQQVSKIQVVTLDDGDDETNSYLSNSNNEIAASGYFSREKEETSSIDVGDNGNNNSSNKKDKLKRKNKKDKYSTANHLKLSNNKKLNKGTNEEGLQNKTDSNKRKKRKLQKHVQNGGINNNNNFEGGEETGGFISKFTKAVEKIFGNSPKKMDSFTTYRNSGGTDGVVSEDENDIKLHTSREILEDLSSTSETENNTRDDEDEGKEEETVYDKFSSSTSSSSESEADDADASKDNQNNVKSLFVTQESDTTSPIKPFKSNNKKISKMKQQQYQNQQQNLVFNSNSNQQNNNNKMMDVHVYAKKSYPVFFNDNDSELQNNDKKNEIISNDMDDEDLDDDAGLVLDSVKRRQLMLQASLTPLDLVWAKYSGFDSWHPGVIIDPNPNISQNNGQIPRPPIEVVNRKPLNGSELLYLVLFFDPKSTWEWVERSELVPLGRNPALDKDQLDLSLKKPNEKKAVRRAYEKAILRQKKRSESDINYVDNNINSPTKTPTKNNNSIIYSD